MALHDSIITILVDPSLTNELLFLHELLEETLKVWEANEWRPESSVHAVWGELYRESPTGKEKDDLVKAGRAIKFIRNKITPLELYSSTDPMI